MLYARLRLFSVLSTSSRTKKLKRGNSDIIVHHDGPVDRRSATFLGRDEKISRPCETARDQSVRQSVSSAFGPERRRFEMGRWGALALISFIKWLTYVIFSVILCSFRVSRLSTLLSSLITWTRPPKCDCVPKKFWHSSMKKKPKIQCEYYCFYSVLTSFNWLGWMIHFFL